MKNSRWWFLSFTLFLPVETQAQSFCFASAVSYYEQVYCELKAKGEAGGLPPFYQFKRNDPTTQALLLKRPALRIGIDLPRPKSKPSPGSSKKIAMPQSELPSPQADSEESKQEGKSAAQKGSKISQARVSPENSACQLRGEKIHCDQRVFKLTGNLRNQKLADNALTASNKMELPIFNGNHQDAKATGDYLVEAYRRYIEKMHAIGLGGVTMTYSKFYFLFFDLQEKGLNFSQRFETMYDFLKKDKAVMGVSEKLTRDQQLSSRDCEILSEKMVVCSREGRNYLYLAMSD